MLNIGGELAFTLQDIDYSSKKDLLDRLRALRESMHDYSKEERKILKPMLAVAIKQAFYINEWELMRYKNFCKYRSEHGYDKVVVQQKLLV